MSMTHEEVVSSFTEVTDLEYITSGGQKHVFSGTHHKFGHVALKIFAEGYEIERIQREIRAMNTLELKDAPKIYEEGIGQIGDKQIYYFIEQFIEGEGLDKIIKRGPIPLERVIDIAHGLLNIIVVAEDKMIVHRDIKPSNIIIGDDGRVWLLDYGIARHIDLTSLTSTADVMAASTPGYAPIEQFRNKKTDIDSRSDLFSIGVTLYECVTGINPYRSEAGNFFEIIDRVETTRLPKINKVTKDGELEELIFTLTQPNQEHRPLNAVEAQEWIDEIKREK